MHLERKKSDTFNCKCEKLNCMCEFFVLFFLIKMIIFVEDGGGGLYSQKPFSTKSRYFSHKLSQIAAGMVSPQYAVG